MPSLPPRRPRILVVDDEREITVLLAEIFADEGFHLTTVTSIEQACRVLAEQRFDLVLADSFALHAAQTLPTTGPIRQAAGTTPVVLFTAHAIEREEALAAGFRDVIAKPFDLEVSWPRYTNCWPSQECIRCRRQAIDNNWR